MVNKKMTLEDIAKKIEIDSEELKSYLNYYTILIRLEKKIDTID